MLREFLFSVRPPLTSDGMWYSNFEFQQHEPKQNGAQWEPTIRHLIPVLQPTTTTPQHTTASAFFVLTTTHAIRHGRLTAASVISDIDRRIMTSTTASTSSTTLTWNVIVTGASRGFGRAMALALCQQHSHGDTSTVSATPTTHPIVINAVFLARSDTGLQALIHDIQSSLNNATTKTTNVTMIPSHSRTDIVTIPTAPIDHNNDTPTTIPQDSFTVHTDHFWVVPTQQLLLPTTLDQHPADETRTSLSVTTAPSTTTTIKLSRIVADLGTINTIDTIIDRTLQCWEEPPVGDNIISNDSVTRNTNDEHHDINGTPPPPPQKVDRYIFINNVGSLGHIGSCATYGATTVHDMHHTMTLNVTNSLWFTTRIVQWFKQQQRTSSGGRDNSTIVVSPPNMIRQLSIVNVSSIVAIQSFPSLATYSAGKAARDMYHNALAKEEAEQLDAMATNNNGDDDSNVTGHGGSIRVLNYAPGPLRTDMTTQLQNNASALHPSIRSFYEETCRNPDRDKNTNNDEEASLSFIDPANSANVLLKLLWKDDYTNGAHVDYYDCL